MSEKGVFYSLKREKEITNKKSICIMKKKKLSDNIIIYINVFIS